MNDTIFVCSRAFVFEFRVNDFLLFVNIRSCSLVFVMFICECFVSLDRALHRLHASVCSMYHVMQPTNEK